jgi:SAM-dependent MidA family methyltransferase
MTLFECISQRIQQQGAIDFSEFMHHALYAPGLGYYSSNTHKFGVTGDFITAPELTPLFGHTLANQCAQILPYLTDPVLFEFGAGTGRLCVDLLTRLQTLNALPHAYHILEVSADLRHRQQQLIAHELPHLLDRVHWLRAWPTNVFEGIVIANEVLDAMPVKRFLQTDEGILNAVITLTAEGVLTEAFQPCHDEDLLQHVQRILPKEWVPYLSEVNVFIDGWLQQCSTMLSRGALILIDYGFPRHEYYHPDRHHGTLMCHYQHQAHTNPLINLGQQDITAHVDFTHVAEAAMAAGFHVAGYTNQASFLLANGLLSLCATDGDSRLNINQQQAIKQLLQPSEMGELFKVMALTKALDLPLDGFQLHDKRASL